MSAFPIQASMAGTRKTVDLDEFGVTIGHDEKAKT